MSAREWFDRFFRRSPRRYLRSVPAATVFDLTDGHRGFGHDLTRRPIDKQGLAHFASGWLTPLPKDGDYAILSDDLGGTTRYRFTNVRHCGNPRDMWHATLIFDPRQSA